MITSDAQYQTKCLVKLYKCTHLSLKDQEDSSEKVLHGIVFAELVPYIESNRVSMETKPIFKITDIKNHYISRLNELALDEVEVHPTRLNARILTVITDIRLQTGGMTFYLYMTKILEQLSNKHTKMFN